MAKMNNVELAALLRKLADFVEERTDAELAPLLDQAGKLIAKSSPRKRQASNSKRSNESIRELARLLEGLPSREAGDALLQQHGLRKIDLEALARQLELPVQRDDSIERLRAKIIEHVIGSRLRSSAIQAGGLAQ